MKKLHWFLRLANVAWIILNTLAAIVLVVIAFVLFGDLRTFFEAFVWTFQELLGALGGSL
jgi:hypothetical protein